MGQSPDPACGGEPGTQVGTVPCPEMETPLCRSPVPGKGSPKSDTTPPTQVAPLAGAGWEAECNGVVHL